MMVDPIIAKASLVLEEKREKQMKKVERRKIKKQRLQEEKLNIQEIEKKLKEEQGLRRREREDKQKQEDEQIQGVMIEEMIPIQVDESEQLAAKEEGEKNARLGAFSIDLSID